MSVMKDVDANAPYKAFAENLRKYRAKTGLTRDQVAVACGISSRTMINYENGTRVPFADTAAKMATLFGISVEELLGIDLSEVKKARPADLAKEHALDRMKSLYGNKGLAMAQNLFDGTVALFAGGTLTKEDEEIFITEMQQLLMEVKEERREKYTREDYKQKDSFLAETKERQREIQDLDRRIADLVAERNAKMQEGSNDT